MFFTFIPNCLFDHTEAMPALLLGPSPDQYKIILLTNTQSTKSELVYWRTIFTLFSFSTFFLSCSMANMQPYRAPLQLHSGTTPYRDFDRTRSHKAPLRRALLAEQRVLLKGVFVSFLFYFFTSLKVVSGTEIALGNLRSFGLTGKIIVYQWITHVTTRI